jgi:hypothetical protein
MVVFWDVTHRFHLQGEATIYQTNSMDQSPSWEAQLVKKVPALYGTWRCITAFTKARSRPLSWARWIQSTPSKLIFYFLKIHFNITLPSTPRSCEWLLPFRLSNQNVARVFYFLHARYMPRPSHPPWFDHPKIFSEKYKLWSLSLYSFLQPPVTSSLVGPIILLRILF